MLIHQVSKWTVDERGRPTQYMVEPARIPASVLAHEGVEYTADEFGVLDVPEELGRRLVRLPTWGEYVEQTASQKVALLEAELERMRASADANPAAVRPVPRRK